MLSALLDCMASHPGGRNHPLYFNGKFVILVLIEGLKGRDENTSDLNSCVTEAARLQRFLPGRQRRQGLVKGYCLCLVSLWSTLWDKDSSVSGLFKVIPGNSSRGVGKSDREGKETNKEFYIRQVTVLVKLVLIPSGQLWEALQKVHLKLFQQRGREAEVFYPQTSHSSLVDGYFWDQKLVLLVCLEWATLSLWLKNHRCFQWAALGVQKWVPRHCGAIYLNTSYRYSGKNSNAQPCL